MKTISIITILLCSSLLPFCIHAQPTPDWNTSGNNITTNYFLGTTNTVDLMFWTDNNEKMRLDTNGNLGIGTTAPGQLLDVDGNINVSQDQWYGIGGDRVLTQDELILKATDGDDFFRITVNSNGELTATRVAKSELDKR